MQLDRTHVAIRLRSLSEIGDLALMLLREYPAAILIGFAVGCAPWVVINTALLAWIPIYESLEGLDDEEAITSIWRYLYWMVTLVFLQTPMAGTPMTVYLGNAVFEVRPPWRQVFADARRHAWRALWSLGIIRLAVPAMVIAACRIGSPASPWWDFFVPSGLIAAAALIRGVRPFLPEILVLEQCPYRSDKPQMITVNRRNRLLHSPIAGDLTGRLIVVACVLGVLALSVLNSLLFVRGIAVGEWSFIDLLVLLVFVPLSLWAIAGISVLVRLLSYLDARIRLEGWEVELAVRAEAIRQFGTDAAANTDNEASVPPSNESTQVAEEVTAS